MTKLPYYSEYINKIAETVKLCLLALMLVSRVDHHNLELQQIGHLIHNPLNSVRNLLQAESITQITPSTC